MINNLPNVTARVSTEICFSVNASVSVGRLRYSSSSEKYSVLRYFRNVGLASSSSDGDAGSSVKIYYQKFEEFDIISFSSKEK